MDIKEAVQIGNVLVKSTAAFCHQVEVAGSVRRQKSEVKDIELVARPSDMMGLIEALRRHGAFIKPGTQEIIPWEPKPDARYLRMMLNEGIKLDLFLANQHNWGPLFAMRTGSGTGPKGPWEGFVPALFGRWKEVSGGGRMVDCLPTLPDGRSVSVPTEVEFFSLCGVEWVEPNERQTRKALKPIPGYGLDLSSLIFV